MSLHTQHDPKNEAEITYWNSVAPSLLAGSDPGRCPEIVGVRPNGSRQRDCPEFQPSTTMALAKSTTSNGLNKGFGRFGRLLITPLGS
jgi:hypothetical protein